MAIPIKLKQLDRAELTAFINELIDGTGAVYTANRALVTDSSGDIIVSSVTSTELGHISGLTSAVQTQINAKLGTSLTSAYIFVGNGSNTATGVAVSGDISISNAGVVAISGGVIVNADVNASAAIALTKLAATTVSRALVSDASGFVSPSSVTSTELGYVSGVTSAIQTQLNNRLPLSGGTITGSIVVTGTLSGSSYTEELVGSQTTDNTQTELFVDGTGGSEQVVIADNTTATFEILLTARRTDSSENDSWQFIGQVHKDATVGTVAIDFVQANHIGSTSWAAEIGEDTATGALKVMVTGENAKTIKWSARVKLNNIAA